jgi:hypothetical protein
MNRMTLFVVACALAACGPKPAPNGVTADDAIVYVKSNVADAQVFIDGRFVGPLGMVRGGIAVEAGKHRLELRRDEYFSRYVELELARAEKKKLELPMAPVLP